MDSKETSANAERYPLFCHAAATAPARNDKNALDCHAVQAPLAMTAAQTKPTRLSLSLACFFALSSMVLTPMAATDSTSTRPNNDATKLQIDSGKTNKYSGKTLADNNSTGARENSGSFISTSVLSRYGSKNDTKIHNYTYAMFSYAYTHNPVTMRPLFYANSKIDYFELDVDNRSDNSNGTPMWRFSFFVDSNCRQCRRNENLTIEELQLKGDTKLEIKLAGNKNTITTLNQNGKSLHLGTNGNSDKLSITTLNQNSAGDTQVFNNVTITNANANNGLIHNNGGTITNANINGGEFRQTNGTTETATLNSGSLTQANGTITTLNQSGGQATQTNGTITNLNLSGGTFTHNGGTLNNVVLKAGGSGSTFVNGTDSAFANITQEGGNHTIIGKVAKFTLASGSVTNNGSIETLTTNTTTTRQARSGTSFYAAQDTRAATNHITNNGTIDNLTLNEATDVINVLDDHNKPIGIIKKLDVKSGNSTINTLTGVAQDPTTGISNINITKDAKLTVDTLRVGLKGNQAIERVTINNNTGTKVTTKNLPSIKSK